MDLFSGRGYNILIFAATIVGIVIAVFSAIFARRAILRRQLVISAIASTPLLTDASASLTDITISHRGQPLRQPYIVTFEIYNGGRRDITSADFDSGRPIVIDLSQPVINLLQASFVRNLGRDPSSRASHTRIEIGPDLIPSKEIIVIQALIDGKPDLQKVVSEHLIETTTKYHRLGEIPGASRPALNRRALVGVTGLVVIALAGVMAATHVLRSHARTVQSTSSSVGTLDLLQLTPGDISAGEAITVEASGFAPNEPLELAAMNVDDGKVYQRYSYQSSKEGHLTARLTIPNGAIHGRTMIAIRGSSSQRSTVGCIIVK